MFRIYISVCKNSIDLDLMVSMIVICYFALKLDIYLFIRLNSRGVNQSRHINRQTGAHRSHVRHLPKIIVGIEAFSLDMKKCVI